MTTEQSLLLDFDALKNEHVQQQLASQAEQFLFPDEQAKRNTAEIVNEFVDDYLLSGRYQPIDQWLIQRFQQYPDIWESDEELREIAETIIRTIDCLTDNQIYIQQQIEKGKTLPNIINRRISEIADAHQISAQDIHQEISYSLQQANGNYVAYYTQKNADLLPPVQGEGVNASRQIAEHLKLNASLNLAWYGAKSIGSRLFNSLTGQKNLSRAEELTKIIRSAVESAENKGIQVAVSGGMVVSAKKGWVKGVFDMVEELEDRIERAYEMISRVQDLALNVADGWNDLRVLDRIEQGVLNVIDATAEKAKFTASKVITKVEQNATNWLRKTGGTLGEKAGKLLGSIFSPAGAVLGGVVGGYLGEKAGEWLGDNVVKPIAETAKKVANKAIDFISDTVKKGVEIVKDIGESIYEGGKKFLSFLKFW